MESNNRKIITVSFLLAAAVVAFTVSVLLETFSGSWGWLARLLANDSIKHGLPIVVGVVLFAVLQFKKDIVLWADDVVSEIKKVVWPSQKDTSAMTIVVTIMLLISGVLIGFLDVLSSYVIKLVVG